MGQFNPGNPADDQPDDQTLAPGADLSTAVAPAPTGDQPGLVGRALNDLMQDVLSSHPTAGDKSTILSAESVQQRDSTPSNCDPSPLSVDDIGVQRIGGTRVSLESVV